MLNQSLFIGRIVLEPELRETESGKKVTNVTIAVPKKYTNSEGVHEADFIECVVWNNEAKKVSEYRKTGDMVLVTARIQTRIVEKDGEKRKYTDIVAEDISLLSKSKKSYEQQINQDDIEEDIER